MDRNNYFFLLIFLVGGFFACSIDEAQSLANKKLVIASDFLYQEDVKFFTEFAKKEKVKIEIVHMRADSILFRLKKDAYNTDIDLLLVQSLLSIKSFGDHAFQEIDHTTQQQLTRLTIFEKNWFLIGRDPFVLTYLKDSLDRKSVV